MQQHVEENFDAKQNNIYILITREIMSGKPTKTNQMKVGKGLHILMVRY